MKAGIIAKVLGGIGLLTLLVLGVAVVANWNNIRIRYHVMLVRDAQRAIGPGNEPNFKYSMHWVRWLAEGRPDSTTQHESGWKHEEALIKLGYCEQRAYSLTNSTIIDLSKTLAGHRFKDALISFTMSRDGRQIVAFAAKEDFPFLEAKIKEVEAKK